MRKSGGVAPIVLAMIVAATLMRLAFAFRPEVQLASRPYAEDAYYLFNTAFHLAHGHGMSNDGVHLTNGVQPLIVFLYAPFFAVAGHDKWLAIRLIFLLVALIEAAALYLLARLLNALTLRPSLPSWQQPPVIGVAIMAFAFQYLRLDSNGLETSLYTMFVLIVLNYLAANDGEWTVPRSMVLGVLLGLTILARIDAVFLLLGVLLTQGIRERGTLVARLTRMIMVALPAVVVSSPWFVYNYLQFGSVMPISGSAQNQEHVLVLNLRQGLVVLADIVSTIFYLPYRYVAGQLGWIWIVVIFLSVSVAAVRFQLVSKLREDYGQMLFVLGPLAFAAAMHVLYYVFLFGSPHFLQRYFQMVRLLWLILFCLSVPLWLPTLWQAKWKRWGTVVVLILAVVFNARMYLDNFGGFTLNDLYQAGRFAQLHPDAKVGMFQSGLGTFMSANVVNLDGKVNANALRARQTTGIGAYILDEKFDYLIDAGHLADELAEEANRSRDTFKNPVPTYRLVDTFNSLRLWQRVAADDSITKILP